MTLLRLLLLFCCATVIAGEDKKTEKPTALYQWQPDTVYRFKYYKLIKVIRTPDDFAACQSSWTAMRARWVADPIAKQQVFAAMLKSSDTDANGGLSESEGNRALLQLGAHPDLFKTLLTAFDADDDGKLNADEWAKAQECETLPKRDDITEIKGVLVIKIDSIEASTGSANVVISFDSPHLEMPPYREYDKKTFRITESAGIGNQNEQSLEELLHRIVWKAKVSKEGQLTVVSRDPDNLTEYSIKIARANRGKKTYATALEAVLSKDLGLGRSDADADLLPIPLGKLPPAPAGALEKIRPFRILVARENLAQARERWTTARQFGTGLNFNEPFELMKLSPIEPPIMLTVNKLDNARGVAIFDSEMGMLEKLDEQYQVDVRLGCSDRQNKQHLDQNISVEFQLERIQPPIRGQQPAAEE